MASVSRQLLFAVLCVVAASVLAAQAAGADDDAGTTTEVGVYELRMGDFCVKVTNWGARLMSVVVSDSKGNLADVVLGKDTIAEYFNDTSYFGPITGRVGQRISRGRFVLDAKSTTWKETTAGTRFTVRYSRPRHPHPQDRSALTDITTRSFALRRWHGVQQKRLDGEGARRRRRLPVHHLVLPQLRRRAGLPGEPGRVRDVPAVGTLHAGRAHERGCAGQGDAGEPPAARVLEPGRARRRRRPGPHAPAPRVAPRGAGRRAPSVVGPRRARRRNAPGLPGADGDRRAHPPGHGRQSRRVRRQLRVIDGEPGAMRPVAEVRDGASGRAVELWANQATVQLYTGNWMNHTEGKDGEVYDQYAGFTLETMGYVDAVNHPEFPSQKRFRLM